MKKLANLLEYNRLKIAIGYFIIIIIISFLAASFREDPDPQNEMAAQDTTKISAEIDSTDIDSANTKSVKEQAIEQKINRFVSTNGGVRFDEKTYNYTLDYQKAYRDTIAIFYVFIEDIYEEKGKTYLKAKKVFSGINIFLKLECDTTQIKKVRSVNFFVNIAAQIQSIEKVLFFTKANISEENEKSNENQAYITFDTLEEGIMMKGKCLEVLI